MTKRALLLLLGTAIPSPAGAAAAQSADGLPPPGLGSLTQSDVALRVRNEDLEIRLVPLDPRVTHLLAKDAYESLRGLVESKRVAIDSVAQRAGIAQPGLALVTFFGQRPSARFDAQTITLRVRNRLLQPLGIVPFTPRFTSQQLDRRDQASALYLFEEELPVNESFTMSYGGLTSTDWEDKLPVLDRERARVAARARGQRPDGR